MEIDFVTRFPEMSDGLLLQWWPVSWLSHIFETAFPAKKIGINCVAAAVAAGSKNGQEGAANLQYVEIN